MQYLWGHKPLKAYGSRVSESVLAVMCHILKGEPAVREKPGPAKATSKAAADTSSTSAPAPASAAPPEPEVNELHLQQVGVHN